MTQSSHHKLPFCRFPDIVFFSWDQHRTLKTEPSPWPSPVLEVGLHGVKGELLISFLLAALRQRPEGAGGWVAPAPVFIATNSGTTMHWLIGLRRCLKVVVDEYC